MTKEQHISEPRINDRIRVPEVRLVGPNGEQVGIVRVEDALRLAAEADLDLVEVAPMAKPPVSKLMDFGKYKYEADMKAREARKNQANTVLKEIKLRPKIDPHDYGTKKGHVERFLKGGDKVKVMIMFRGREQSRPEMGFRLLQRLAEDVPELGTVESAPKQDGRNMIMVLGPTKKKAEAMAEQRRKRTGPPRASTPSTTRSTWAPSSTPRPTSRPRATRPRPAEVEATRGHRGRGPRRSRPTRGRDPRGRGRRGRGPEVKARRAVKARRGKAAKARGHDPSPRPDRPPHASTTETLEGDRHHAEDQDAQRRQEALPGDRDRQGHARAGRRPSTCSSEKTPQQAPRSSAWTSSVSKPDAKKVKKLLGR